MPGATSSAVIAALVHGGELVSPGTQGGEFVSPANALIERAHSKVTEIPSIFRFFMLHLFVGIRVACFPKRLRRSVFSAAYPSIIR